MKKCLLMIGDVGNVEAHWSQLIQPAVYFYQHEYNVIIIDTPSLGSSQHRWIQYGPSIIRGTLQYLEVAQVSVFSMGLGCCLFLQILGETPHVLSTTHVMYNQDMPADRATFPFDVFEVEVALRDNDVQIWVIYNDDEDEDTDPRAYSKHNKGASRLGDMIVKMQARLESERRISDSERIYDEILTTEKLNTGAIRVEKVWVSRVPIHVFRHDVLFTMQHYLRQYPSSVQDDVVDGLVKDLLDYFREDIKEIPELPALKPELLNRSDKVRRLVSSGNRKRLELVQESMLALTAPQQAALPGKVEEKVETLALSRRGTGSKLAAKMRSKSNLTVVSEDAMDIDGDLDDEEESLVDSSKDYREQWAALQPIRRRAARKGSEPLAIEAPPVQRECKGFLSLIAAGIGFEGIRCASPPDLLQTIRSSPDSGRLSDTESWQAERTGKAPTIEEQKTMLKTLMGEGLVEADAQSDPSTDLVSEASDLECSDSQSDDEPHAFYTEDTVLIFDWDDTMLPSSWLSEQSLSLDEASHISSEQEAQLAVLAQTAAKTLRVAKRYGKVVLVTNAECGWIELSCQKFMPSLYPHLEDVTLFSARSTYENQGMAAPFQWKYLAFETEICNYYESLTSDRLKNVISFGDSFHEREAVIRVTERLKSGTRMLRAGRAGM
ncbi:URA1 [Symbiodinium sp. KB8]|nr:URA1 [Symbiodinium sp. KB8]